MTRHAHTTLLHDVLVWLRPCSWSKASGSSSRSSGLSQGGLLAVVIVPIVVVSLAGVALAFIMCKRSQAAAGAAGSKDVDDPGKGPPFLPKCLLGAGGSRDCGRTTGQDSREGSSRGGDKIGAGMLHVVAVKDESLVERTPSGGSATASGTDQRKSLGSASNSASRAQSGFSDDVAQVRQLQSLHSRCRASSWCKRHSNQAACSFA